LSLRALNRATLARQYLLRREKTTVVRANEQLAGMQAQIARPPFVGLWSRVDGFDRTDLITALRNRTVVRGTAMRGTIHLMSARDFVALRGAIQPVLTRGMQAGLDKRAADLDLSAVIADARRFFVTPATFEAFRTYLEGRDHGGDVRALAYAVRMSLPLVQVPGDHPWGFTAAADFASAERWLKTKISTRPAPPRELVRRYLAAFGPATPADAQVWSGLQGLREVFEAMRPGLATFRDERGRELFDLPDAPRPDEDTAAPIRFVPEYDNLLLAHADRTRVLADEHRSRITLKNLVVQAAFLVDGVVAGLWKVERTARTAVLSLEPFVRLPKETKRALEEEGDTLLRFVEPDAPARLVKFKSQP
jgi:hypothetical protein